MISKNSAQKFFTAHNLVSIIAFIGILILASCSPKTPNVQEIIDSAIAQSGGTTIANASIQFKFRDQYYRAKRENGIRTFERCMDKECILQRDVLDSKGDFTRFRESELIHVPDSMKQKYANSVNSVHYFSVLPYGLNDPAVTKELIDIHDVKGQSYYRVKVTFAQEGGGEDFQDQYMYWIATEDYTVDYIAYNYQVDEGGTRFREAYNERIVNGVRFVDYRNYKPKTQFPPLTDLDAQFENNELKLLSTIETENPEVTPLAKN